MILDGVRAIWVEFPKEPRELVLGQMDAEGTCVCCRRRTKLAQRAVSKLQVLNGHHLILQGTLYSQPKTSNGTLRVIAVARHLALQLQLGAPPAVTAHPIFGAIAEEPA